jgi:hypothetical protein
MPDKRKPGLIPSLHGDCKPLLHLNAGAKFYLRIGKYKNEFLRMLKGTRFYLYLNTGALIMLPLPF